MTDAALDLKTTPAPSFSVRGRLYALFLKSEALRGFALLSPTLILMLCAMCVPFGIMVVISFWTQTGFEYDKGFYLTNYQEFFERPAYGWLLLRSLNISAACTVATRYSSPTRWPTTWHFTCTRTRWPGSSS